MGDCHSHYLKKDGLLLADVFEKLIDTCLKYYGLDPCHYFSSPGYHVKNDWDKIGNISDTDKYLFIETGLRIGISYITKRYAKANNKYINDHDSKKQSIYNVS